MASDFELFSNPITSKNSVINAGSKLLLCALPTGFSGKTGPPEITLTQKTSTAVSVGGTSLTITPSEDVILADGVILYFTGNKKFVVNGTQTVTGTDFVLAIDPATTGNTLSGGETCLTWGVLALNSPTDIPLNQASNMEGRGDLNYGFQKGQNLVGTTFAPQITCFTTNDDIAYDKLIKPYDGSGNTIFAMIWRGDGRWAAGEALVVNLTENGAESTQIKPTFTLDFRPPWVMGIKYSEMTDPQKAEANLIMKKSGLPLLA